MSALSEACRRPFSNGTEESAWLSAWCEYCVHDHAVTHQDDPDGDGCELMLGLILDADGFWPEAWLPEPDDGKFFLPSRMVCLRFSACSEGGCSGDPGAVDRAERVADVTEYWRTRRD